MNFKEDIINGKVCPYCGNPSEYVDSKEIYGKSYGMAYLCRPCNAYVGVHNEKSKKAKGRLANKELRRLKIDAHNHFDPLWKRAVAKGRSKKEARTAAYRWLAEQLDIDPKYCHFGMFDCEMCRKAVQVCKPYLK